MLPFQMKGLFGFLYVVPVLVLHSLLCNLNLCALEKQSISTFCSEGPINLIGSDCPIQPGRLEIKLEPESFYSGLPDSYQRACDPIAPSPLQDENLVSSAATKRKATKTNENIDSKKKARSDRGQKKKKKKNFKSKPIRPVRKKKVVDEWVLLLSGNFSHSDSQPSQTEPTEDFLLEKESIFSEEVLERIYALISPLCIAKHSPQKLAELQKNFIHSRQFSRLTKAERLDGSIHLLQLLHNQMSLINSRILKLFGATLNSDASKTEQEKLSALFCAQILPAYKLLRASFTVSKKGKILRITQPFTELQILLKEYLFAPREYPIFTFRWPHSAHRVVHLGRKQITQTKISLRIITNYYRDTNSSKWGVLFQNEDAFLTMLVKLSNSYRTRAHYLMSSTKRYNERIPLLPWLGEVLDNEKIISKFKKVFYFAIFSQNPKVWLENRVMKLGTSIDLNLPVTTSSGDVSLETLLLEITPEKQIRAKRMEKKLNQLSHSPSAMSIQATAKTARLKTQPLNNKDAASQGKSLTWEEKIERIYAWIYPLAFWKADRDYALDMDIENSLCSVLANLKQVMGENTKILPEITKMVKELHNYALSFNFRLILTFNKSLSDEDIQKEQKLFSEFFFTQLPSSKNELEAVVSPRQFSKEQKSNYLKSLQTLFKHYSGVSKGSIRWETVESRQRRTFKLGEKEVTQAEIAFNLINSFYEKKIPTSWLAIFINENGFLSFLVSLNDKVFTGHYPRMSASIYQLTEQQGLIEWAKSFSQESQELEILQKKLFNGIPNVDVNPSRWAKRIKRIDQ
ncbi:hypothetical protein O181_058834 [Austropuccinia psidii MF-1]|uniref:Uncharacterized protein n=1 Tax=Austropuccinia psidii MF-1 TaxID=1389203 RepID=A0A9Q3ED58_9BASI|nr:hypothetical protein [Austropuccinia psidii MF-1]